MTLEEHLEIEFLKLFPGLTHFWVGANDDDCLTINFELGGRDHEYWQTVESMSLQDSMVFTDQLSSHNEVHIPLGEGYD